MLKDRLVATNEVPLDSLDFVGIECDVSDEKSVQKAMDQIIARWGRIDTVVASAGETGLRSLMRINAESDAGIVHNHPSLEYVHCACDHTCSNTLVWNAQVSD